MGIQRLSMKRARDDKKEAGAASEASSDGLDPEVVAKARASIGIPKADLLPMLSDQSDYDKVLMACAKNAKMGPFTATSGLILDYYLNVSTNMMDPGAATSIARMSLDVLQARFKPDDGSKLYVVGMEMAGGVMVGQCAAVTGASLCIAAKTGRHRVRASNWKLRHISQTASQTVTQSRLCSWMTACPLEVPCEMQSYF